MQYQKEERDRYSSFARTSRTTSLRLNVPQTSSPAPAKEQLGLLRIRKQASLFETLRVVFQILKSSVPLGAIPKQSGDPSGSESASRGVTFTARRRPKSNSECCGASLETVSMI